MVDGDLDEIISKGWEVAISVCIFITAWMYGVVYALKVIYYNS